MSKRRIEVPSYIRGLVFDCDGTLVDSMPLHMRAWEHVITLQGGAWNYDYFFSKKGMPEEDIVGIYNQNFGYAFDPVRTVQAKHDYFYSRLDELSPISEVVDVARRYLGVIPMSVASGGTRKTVELELEALNILQFFPVILTADDGIKPKPAPDIFLEAARRMQVEPEQCQVFEDGDLGLEAAYAAGMLATDVR